MNTSEMLVSAFKEALNEIEPTSGKWTLTGFTGSMVPVGKVELKSGRIAVVRITVDTDFDDIDMDEEDVEKLKVLTL